MTTYRIVRVGTHYEIEFKDWLFWNTLWTGADLPAEFRSVVEAERQIDYLEEVKKTQGVVKEIKK